MNANSSEQKWPTSKHIKLHKQNSGHFYKNMHIETRSKTSTFGLNPGQKDIWQKLRMKVRDESSKRQGRIAGIRDKMRDKE